MYTSIYYISFPFASGLQPSGTNTGLSYYNICFLPQDVFRMRNSLSSMLRVIVWGVALRVICLYCPPTNGIIFMCEYNARSRETYINLRSLLLYKCYGNLIYGFLNITIPFKWRILNWWWVERLLIFVTSYCKCLKTCHFNFFTKRKN